MTHPKNATQESTVSDPALTAAKRYTIADFLQQIEEGRFIANCTDEQQTLVRQMQNLHAAGISKSVGKMTIEIVIKQDGGVFDVVGDVKLKMPKLPKTRSVMFAGRDGSLSNVNREQLGLPLQDVSPTALRRV